jgi:hypothetical protein
MKEWIKTNYKWFFSGLGVFILTSIIATVVWAYNNTVIFTQPFWTEVIELIIIPEGNEIKNEECKPFIAVPRGLYTGLIVLLILIILIRQITVKGLDEIFNIIKQDENLKMTISILQADIQKGSTGIQDKLSTKELSFFKSKNLIKSKKNGEFNWTKKGLELNERMSNTTNWDGELGPK